MFSIAPPDCRGAGTGKLDNKVVFASVELELMKTSHPKIQTPKAPIQAAVSAAVGVRSFDPSLSGLWGLKFTRRVDTPAFTDKVARFSGRLAPKRTPRSGNAL
jgi:hypothetical protein